MGGTEELESKNVWICVTGFVELEDLAEYPGLHMIIHAAKVRSEINFIWSRTLKR
jgi:hypothetical protein